MARLASYNCTASENPAAAFLEDHAQRQGGCWLYNKRESLSFPTKTDARNILELPHAAKAVDMRAHPAMSTVNGVSVNIA